MHANNHHSVKFREPLYNLLCFGYTHVQVISQKHHYATAATPRKKASEFYTLEGLRCVLAACV